jgi:4-amino-4-deoxy-L-arabinose transferase-like glycosyltransferase
VIKRGPAFGFSLPLFSLLPLLLLWKFLKTGKKWYIFFAMFLLGLGWNAKGFYIWFIIGFLMSTVFCYFDFLRKINYKVIWLAIFSFFAGALPVLYFYCDRRFIDHAIFSTTQITNFGHNNALILQNLAERLLQLNTVLGGPNIMPHFWRNIPPFIFWTSCFYIIMLVIFRETTLGKKQIVHVFSTFLLVLLVSVYSFTDLRLNHLYILIPYSQFLIAIAIVELFKQNKRIGSVLAAACFITLTVYNSQLWFERYVNNKKVNINSCSISALAHWLLNNKYYNVTAFDSYVYFGLRVFSNLKICNRQFPFWAISQITEETKNNIYRSLHTADDQAIFIMSYSSSQLEVNNYIKNVLEKLNKRVFIIKDFLGFDGRRIRLVRVFCLRD